jgi:hypothetical protein
MTSGEHGYPALPSSMNSHQPLWHHKPLRRAKLCGASESDFLCVFQVHIGYLPVGPLNSRRSPYLRARGPALTPPYYVLRL